MAKRKHQKRKTTKQTPELFQEVKRPKRERTVAERKLALHGIEPRDRMDRPSRRASGGRAKHHTTTIVIAAPQRQMPDAMAMQPQPSMPVAGTAPTPVSVRPYPLAQSVPVMMAPPMMGSFPVTAARMPDQGTVKDIAANIRSAASGAAGGFKQGGSVQTRTYRERFKTATADGRHEY